MWREETELRSNIHSSFWALINKLFIKNISTFQKPQVFSTNKNFSVYTVNTSQQYQGFPTLFQLCTSRSPLTWRRFQLGQWWAKCKVLRPDFHDLVLQTLRLDFRITPISYWHLFKRFSLNFKNIVAHCANFAAQHVVQWYDLYVDFYSESLQQTYQSGSMV